MDSLLIMALAVGLTALAFVLTEAVYILTGSPLEVEEDQDYGLE